MNDKIKSLVTGVVMATGAALIASLATQVESLKPQNPGDLQAAAMYVIASSLVIAVKKFWPDIVSMLQSWSGKKAE